jgi:TolB-like protein
VPRKRMGARVAVPALVLLLVIAAAVALLRERTGAATADRTRTETRIAVLPFTLLGEDTTGSYMAEGLADEVMTSLAQVRGLRVAPRSAAARFAGQPVRDAARALEVDAVMEGSVRRAGDRLRVSAQLTSAEDGLVVWARSFDRAAGDAFTLQEDIARELVAALRDTLGAATAPMASAGGTVDPEAYDLFLRGRYFWSRRGAALPTAIDYFAQAAARDPRFARAKAGLAIGYQSLAYYGGGSADSLMALAEPMALAALQLDSTLADAHLALGGIRRYQWRWADAERHLRRAAELAPDDATAHQWLGGVLYATGRAGDAVGEMRQARRLDPFSAAIAGDVVYTLLIAGDTAMTREAARMMELDTTLAVSHMIAGLVALWNGRPEEALRALATARQLRNAPELRGFEVAALRAAGRNAAAGRLYRELLQAQAQGTAANADAAYAAAAMGDTERAFALLDRMVERHEPLVTEISVPCDSGFAALHGDPRFAALLSRAGMQPCRR